MTPRRISVVSNELLGVASTGGPGTADSLLAVALGRRGHEVQLLVAPGRDVSGLSPEWKRRYGEANVRVVHVSERVVVRPSFLAPAAHVYETLRDDPPDVVVADDWRALAWAALRSRQLGRAFPDTAFIVYSHGPARVFAEAARKVPDTVDRFGEELAQRACLELADALVSPSEWLVRWLREHEWTIPRSARVIQNLWQSTALDESAEAAEPAPIHRLAFFGQVREGKGVRLFIESVRSLPPGLEVLFLGHSRNWTSERLQQAIGRQVRLEPNLDRDAALAELKQPGTLAVMPSLLENSPYAVAECIEHRIPFVATGVGGTPELVAAEDRGRVLCEPTAAALTAAVTNALQAPAPAGPARPPGDSLTSWLELVETIEPAQRTSSTAAGGDWASFGSPDPELFAALAAAQAASGAGVVTTGVQEGDAVRLFLGDAGPLGLVANHYGTVGIVRGSASAEESPWVLCARQAAAGAEVVSIPEPLASAAAQDEPGERLAVLEVFEHADGRALRQLPQLAATLGAALARPRSVSSPPGIRQRLRRLLG
jgi:glycosyltransferase involved in cell wall biosynthesis